jgi:hypothetical protein
MMESAHVAAARLLLVSRNRRLPDHSEREQEVAAAAARVEWSEGQSEGEKRRA